MMGLFRTLFVVMLFSARISLSSAYSVFDEHEKHPNICGGHCRGGTGLGLSGPPHPCGGFGLDFAKQNECQWANDHCCPPNGDGSQWTSTTTTEATTTETSGLDTVEIFFIIFGVIILIFILAGVFSSTCFYGRTTRRTQRYLPSHAAIVGPSYGYPGTGVGGYYANDGFYSGTYQPSVPQPLQVTTSPEGVHYA